MAEVPLITVYAKITLIVMPSGLIVIQLSIDSYHSLFTTTIMLEMSGQKICDSIASPNVN